ncbi:MAG: phosphoribosylformylglycinamidine cyclo-ligase, partial [Candidatus Cloacimonetes bacterium]|nr:phosphoribosylformylglycinamidine cyclo-ligase [Candidatus Cloacimonadota bacterium]
VDGNKIGISSDGIGTKIELAERTGIYNTIAYDLVAMVVDDLAANGFEPCSLSNILDVDLLDKKIVDDLMRGLAQAAAQAEVSITGGEIAELGSRISGYGKNMHFNWGATGIGILPHILSQPISGKEVEAGDVVLSFKSRGFRSNGFSLIRRIMKKNFGIEWHKNKYSHNKSWGEILLTPSLIFTPLINRIIINKIIPHAIVHVTGGGLPDNLKRILTPNNLGAELSDVHTPQKFVTDLQKMGNIKEKEAYRLWNMGNGFLVILNKDKIEELQKISSKLNYKINTAGKIVKNSGIRIKSKGADPQELFYRNTD